MIRLTKKSYALLLKCLKSHNPQLIEQLINDITFSADFYNELRTAVGEELCEKGFNDGWEPNEYGIELEYLIDEIGRLFI